MYVRNGQCTIHSFVHSIVRIIIREFILLEVSVRASLRPSVCLSVDQSVTGDIRIIQMRVEEEERETYLGHERIAASPSHLVGDGIEEERQLPYHPGTDSAQPKVVAKVGLPSRLVQRMHSRRELSGPEHVDDREGSEFAALHREVDALTSERIDETSGVAGDQESVAVAQRHALAADTQRRRLHAFDFRIFAERCRNERVVLDCILVETAQILRLDVAALARVIRRNQIVAIVELIVRVPEDRRVARERFAMKETHTIE